LIEDRLRRMKGEGGKKKKPDNFADRPSYSFSSQNRWGPFGGGQKKGGEGKRKKRKGERKDATTMDGLRSLLQLLEKRRDKDQSDP